MVVDPGSAKLGLASDFARTGGGGLDGGTDGFGSKLHLASGLRGHRSRLAGIIGGPGESRALRARNR
jgi:hypothetical protein